MIYLPAILPFFKIHVNQVLARDDSPAANIISMHVVGEGTSNYSAEKVAGKMAAMRYFSGGGIVDNVR